MDVQVAVDAYGRVLTSTGTPPVGGGLTATDKTVTSATGSSQTLAAAAATRKAILIKNGNSNTGINLLGGTAAIGGAGTITLAPLEGLYLEGAVCPVGAITAISTAAAYISAIEYT
jgi:hypothetical protein